MKTLFQLLSEQALPSAMAVRAIRPDEVICLDTGSFSSQMFRLEQITYTRHRPEKFHPYDLQKNAGILRPLLEKARANGEVWINFTGGTKMMALPAVMLGLELGCRCAYVDTRAGEIVEITKDFQEVRSSLGKNDFSISDLIVLAGEQEVADPGQDNPEGRSDVSLQISKSPLAGDLIGEMNRWMDETKKKGQSCLSGYIVNKRFKASWGNGNFSLEGVASTPLTGMHPDPAFYLGAGWVEELAAIRLNRSRIFNEVRLNLKIEWSKQALSVIRKQYSEVKNEVDLVALYNWIPIIIECKAGIARPEHLPKLKFLRDHLCGSFGIAILATRSDPSELIIEQARNQNIHIISGRAWDALAENVRRCCDASVPQVIVR